MQKMCDWQSAREMMQHIGTAHITYAQCVIHYFACQGITVLCVAFPVESCCDHNCLLAAPTRQHLRTIEVVVIFIIEVPFYHTFGAWLSFVSFQLFSLLLLVFCLRWSCILCSDTAVHGGFAISCVQ